jgi:hypothetical protein
LKYSDNESNDDGKNKFSSRHSLNKNREKTTKDFNQAKGNNKEYKNKPYTSYNRY